MIIEDTIVAVSTAIAPSALAMVRLSGPNAVSIARCVFMPDISRYSPRLYLHGRLLHPQTNKEIDDVMCVRFAAPASYTGEDTVEISCHGGLAVVQSVMEAILVAGARQAERGEFTRRAFLNGRLDLAQAEAVNDLIRSSTDAQRRAAIDQLEGSLSTRVREIDARLLGLMAAVEAAIDFPEDVEDPAPSWLREETGLAMGEIGTLLNTFSTGRLLREGIRLVIAGRVNVGKSSILNALLRHNRAIVTPIPGTTRDLIQETLQICGIPVIAVDTAGVRETHDPVEQAGVKLTIKSIDRADVVLLVVSAPDGLHQDDIAILERLSGKPYIVVLNKTDMVSLDVLDALEREWRDCIPKGTRVARICAKTGEGTEALEGEVYNIVSSEQLQPEAVLLTNARHRWALSEANASLTLALAGVEQGRPSDIVSIDIASARQCLRQVTGESADCDLLDRIFSQFCIGK